MCHANTATSSKTPVYNSASLYKILFILFDLQSILQQVTKTYKYKLVYYTSNFIIMYFDVLILEDVNHTWILFVFDRMEKQHWN